MKVFKCLLVQGFVLLELTALVPAQTFLGGLRGAVRDADGVIPRVSVALVDEGTNATRTTVTNAIGEFSFANVQPGTYTLQTQVDGFRPFEQTGIEIGVQRFIVLDVLLEIGGIEETITVMGEPPLLETATASRSSSLESVEMETLPAASRNPFFLSITTPNVVPTGNSYFTRMQDQGASSALSIGGGPQRGNNYTLDGVPITDL